MSTEFRPPSKAFTPRDYQFIVLTFVILASVCYGLVQLNLRFIGGGGEFYVHWVGARAFAFNNIEPYSGEVASRTQRLVYGDVNLEAGEKPYILDTPFHIFLIYFIFSPLTTPELARAIFTVILELALIPLALFSLRLTDWEPPLWIYGVFILFAMLGFYSTRSIYEASPVILLSLLYAGMLLCLRMELDELAGALIAFSLYYWEVGGLFLALILLRVRAERRNGVFAGLFMVSVILLVLAFLFYPGWFIPFLRAAVNNQKFDFGLTSITALTHIWPAHGRLLAQGILGLLAIAIGYEFTLAGRSDFRHFYWTACLTFAVMPLLGFRTEVTHLAVMLIPFALILSIVYDRWERYSGLLMILLVLAAGGLPWLIQNFAPNNNEWLFLYYPLLNVIGLYWVRWWAVRPARTWGDYVRKY